MGRSGQSVDAGVHRPRFVKIRGDRGEVGPARPGASITALSGLRDRLHKIEAMFDLAEQARQILLFPRGETGQDLLLLSLETRNELAVERMSLACQAQHELAAVVVILEAFQKIPLH